MSLTWTKESSYKSLYFQSFVLLSKCWGYSCKGMNSNLERPRSSLILLMLIIFYGFIDLARWSSSLYLNSDITALILLQQGGINQSAPPKVSGNQIWSIGRKEKEAEREGRKEGVRERGNKKNEKERRKQRAGRKWKEERNKERKRSNLGKEKNQNAPIRKVQVGFFFSVMLTSSRRIVHTHRRGPGVGCEVYIDVPLLTWHHLTAAHKTQVLCRGNPYISMAIQQNSRLQQHKLGTEPALKSAESSPLTAFRRLHSDYKKASDFISSAPFSLSQAFAE